MLRTAKKVIIGLSDWFLYTVLKEKQKKALANLLTTKQKERIKSILKPGKKQAQLRKVDRLKYRLRELGFHETALAELKSIVQNESQTYLRQLAAWEIALWHANQYTKEDARECLTYLSIATEDIKDKDYLRSATILQAESLEILGEKEEAKQVISRALASDVHPDLYLAAANVEDTPADRIQWMNKALEHFHIPKVGLKNGELSPYDQLSVTSNIAAKGEQNAKVTIIIPIYNAGEEVRTALDSIIAQTWENLEIFAVDDCSTDHTMEILKEYEKQDPRIQVLSTPENSGAYVARNIALAIATGDFVTINDADDWSHPLKIETQVRHLLENKQYIGNFSQQARTTNELKFYRRGKPGLYIFSNMSSFMFRREPVFQKIGYWDSVRFAGDSEFVKRIKLIFGEKSIKELPTALHSFQRQSESSLTGNSAFGFPGFFMGARKEYAEAHDYFHETHPEQLRYDFPLNKRLFPAPEPMWPKRAEKEEGKRHFDVILASEFRLQGGTNMSNIEEIKAQKRSGLKTGLVQLNRYDLQSAREMNPKVREHIDGETVQVIVYGEKVTCDVLIIRHPPVLQEWQQYVPGIDAKKVYMIANQTPKKEYSETGERLYDIQTVDERIQAYFGKKATWYPIGPLIREVMVAEHKDEIANIDLAEQDWINIIDVDEWKREQRPKNNKIKIGRHSRDQYVKWPIDKEEMLAVYPPTDPYEIHVLGGAKMPKKVLGELPKNWHVYEFGELHPRDFLKEMDVFAYYTHPELVEAFGRVIFEAMAVGVPVIIPPNYKVLFQDAAIYAEPKEVKAKIDELMNDDALYEKQVKRALHFVEENFGYTKHEQRLGEFSRAK